MSHLNILAVQNAPLLRAVAENPTTSKAELATLVGKDRSNLNRSISALAEAGLLIGTDDGERGLTDAGRAQLAAIERAEGGQGEPGSSAAVPPDHVVVVHAQLIPDPENARKDWDSASTRAACCRTRWSRSPRPSSSSRIGRRSTCWTGASGAGARSAG
jgi:DNA-binding MarR family transcriptional regulator